MQEEDAAAAEAAAAKAMTGRVASHEPSVLALGAQRARQEAAYIHDQIEKSLTCSLGGRVHEALQASRIVRQACTNSILGATLAVDALEAHGRLEEAIEEAREGVAKLPREPTLRLRLARLLASKGRPNEAEEELNAILAPAAASTLEARSADARAAIDRASGARAGLQAAMQHKAQGNTAYGASSMSKPKPNAGPRPNPNPNPHT